MYSVAFIHALILLACHVVVIGLPVAIGFLLAILSENPAPLALAVGFINTLSLPIHLYLVAWLCANHWGPNSGSWLLPRGKHWLEAVIIGFLEGVAAFPAGLIGVAAFNIVGSAFGSYFVTAVVWLPIVAALLMWRRKAFPQKQKSKRKPRSKRQK